MNLSFSKTDKIAGFSAFVILGIISGLALYLQATDLKYPIPTALTFAALPLVIRVVFDYPSMRKVIMNEAG